MKVIIAGSRNITSFAVVEAAIKQSGFEITEVVSGRCRGVDLLGEDWAKRNGIPVKPFPADWDKHGKSAGPIRNMQMAEYAEALIAIPKAHSKGTKDMIRRAEAWRLKIYIHPA